MKEKHQRAFIFGDEWIGMLLSVFLYERGSFLFWIVCPLWLIAVYGISYPLYWWCREDAGIRTPMRPLFNRWSRNARRRLRSKAPTCVADDCSERVAWECWPSNGVEPDGSDATYTCGTHLAKGMGVLIGKEMAEHWLVYPVDFPTASGDEL